MKPTRLSRMSIETRIIVLAPDFLRPVLRPLYRILLRLRRTLIGGLLFRKPPVGDVYRKQAAHKYVEVREKQEWWHKEQAGLKELLKEIPDKTSVLDVPFGTGRFVEYYLEKDQSVYGLDISADMLEVARQALDSRADKCAITIGDATRLPYRSEAFDVVVCFRFLSSIICYRDAKTVLAELCRVTRGYAILEFHWSQNSVRRWRAPGAAEAMGSQLFFPEIVALLREHGFAVVKVSDAFKETPRSSTRAILCRKEIATH